MSKKHLVPIIILVLVAALTGGCRQTSRTISLEEPPGDGFYKLFNGRDFAGWNIEPDLGAWYVEDDMIHCKGQPREPYLIRTKKEFENFDFYVEFNVSKECNSGVFFHIPEAGRQSKLGFEAQILDDAGKTPTKNSTGSIYDVVAPRINAMRPAGEWNQYRVLFDWPVCKIWLNGILVQDVDFAEHPELKYRMRRGPIGLSNHGHVVHYRNLWIKELPDREQWMALFNGADLKGWKMIGDANWHVEDGAIVVTKGEGYLVSEQQSKDFHFQAVIVNDQKEPLDGGIYYRWIGMQDPGYLAEYFSHPQARELYKKYGDHVPASALPLFSEEWLPYQVISSDRESRFIINGITAAENRLLGKVRPGHIAFSHPGNCGVLRIKNVRIKQLANPGI